MEWFSLEIVHPAVGYIVTAGLAGVLGWFGKRISDLREHKSQLKNELDDIKKTLQENTLLTCKAIIYSEIESISLSEKLKAYAIYRSYGGNGYAYQHMQKLLDSDPDRYLENHPVH